MGLHPLDDTTYSLQNLEYGYAYLSAQKPKLDSILRLTFDTSG
jgi:hypothetical protein